MQSEYYFPRCKMYYNFKEINTTILKTLTKPLFHIYHKYLINNIIRFTEFSK